MTILNIYSLNDTESQNIIASLPEGKHVIGRGDLLKVTDKRVSRKHAVIQVSNDKISLTSVHVNPCFFKAANGHTLTVINQNQQNELNDGDQFALLPESCWFKVKIKSEQQADGHVHGDSTSEINGKRFHENNLEETDFPSDSKRARLSESHETSIHNQDNSATTSNTTSEAINNVQNCEVSHSDQEIEGLTAHLHENMVEESNMSLHPEETAITKDENKVVNMEIKRESENRDLPPSTSCNLLENSRTNTTTIEPNVNTGQKIKQEPLNISNSEELHLSSEGATIQNDITSPINDNVIDQQPIIKTENVDKPNKDEASGSGNGANHVRRERCWYGDSCFRKNPNHRASFAHPGDQDYASDPDVDRPDCPYGDTCYRKNIVHRRDYKHKGKPAPKPKPGSRSPSPPSSPITQNNPPNQKKPRRAATKKTKPSNDIDSSQDDYDLEDPFINDGSSDDFEPSDDGIDSDSDWEDSQEVESQERKRMLKEAKKFTKQGKKN